MSLFKKKKRQVLDVETAALILNRAGFSAVLTPDPEDGQVYVGIKTDNIEYDLLFKAISIDYPVLMDVIKTMPHYKWVLAIFQKYKPQIIKVEGGIAFDIRSQIDISKYPRLDSRLATIVTIISEPVIGYLGILQLPDKIYKDQKEKYYDPKH